MLQPRRVGVRDAKMNLSRLLKEVQKGTEVVITERGRPVGRITSVLSDSLSFQDRIENLERLGWVEPSRKKTTGCLPPPLPLQKGKAQAFLREHRDT